MSQHDHFDPSEPPPDEAWWERALFQNEKMVDKYMDVLDSEGRHVRKLVEERIASLRIEAGGETFRIAHAASLCVLSPRCRDAAQPLRPARRN